jgi:two-component system cell cycle sensor histidine kinase/response regulator CckA
MGGKEAIQELLKIDPEVKAIVSSGYSNDPVIQDYGTYGFKSAIAKPFMLGDLNIILSKVVGSVKIKEPSP